MSFIKEGEDHPALGIIWLIMLVVVFYLLGAIW